ncbi:ABC transporter permease [Acuticoccus sp. MNP-M23]|uniref:ABC transporter permease n=1 Tax=Acuticoccus sp. MNP-M23 TaxID=3072793 RepID=UPI0028156622|nr:ABC transporter permease [Acuticoccus sp. MNP-M23]WMS41945.1 ABC transporter permease [Acuticoccus sp. MNP-M23]
MGFYLLKRALYTVPMLLGVLTLVFILVRIVPGDPAIVIMGDNATAEALAELRTRLGLDLPIWRQYVTFMGDVLSGDLGRSLVTNRPVLADVWAVLPYTIELTITSLAIGVLGGVPLGILAARKRDGVMDWLARIISLAGLSFPAFISAVLMLLFFSIHLGWFPVLSRGYPLDEPVERLRSLALPALNLGLIMMAYITRVTRSAMLKALSEDYMRTARAKGVPGLAVIWRHGFRNVLIPVITVIGLYFGVLMGNSVLTEIVFNRPGLGKLIIGALDKRDYTMLQGLMVIYAFIIAVVNLATDLAYGFVDPRVKTK